MTPAFANLIAASALIGVSLFAYVLNGFSSESTLIPVGFGVLLLALQIWVRKRRFWALALAALLTLVVLVALATPLTSSIEKGATWAVTRVATMMTACAVSLIAFGAAAIRR